jgi:hypothetical protein
MIGVARVYEPVELVVYFQSSDGGFKVESNSVRVAAHTQGSTISTQAAKSPADAEMSRHLRRHFSNAPARPTRHYLRKVVLALDLNRALPGLGCRLYKAAEGIGQAHLVRSVRLYVQKSWATNQYRKPLRTRDRNVEPMQAIQEVHTARGLGGCRRRH